MLALRMLSEGGGGPNTGLLWMLYIGMAFFFLVVIVGWWTSLRKPDQPEVRHEAKESPRKRSEKM